LLFVKFVVLRQSLMGGFGGVMVLLSSMEFFSRCFSVSILIFMKMESGSIHDLCSMLKFGDCVGERGVSSRF